MTRRSLELIAAADVVLYDRLIPPDALDGARPDAELRYVGKEPGAAALSQEETNELLVALGRLASGSCASRAATRSCSGAAARRRRRSPLRVLPSRSFPA
jgi:siroheme synthase